MLNFWTLLGGVCSFRMFAAQAIHLLRHCPCTSQTLSYGISADLRFVTFLLSIQVGQLCSEIESKARNQVKLDLTAFFMNYESVTPRSHKRHQMDFKLTNQYHNVHAE